MAFAPKLIKISFVFVFQNDPQTPYLIHEKSMVKSADNFTICFRAQTTSIYTVSQMWVVQINVDQTNLKDLSQFYQLRSWLSNLHQCWSARGAIYVFT